MVTITVLLMYQALNTGHNIQRMYKTQLTWQLSWLIDTEMILPSSVLDFLMNLQVLLMTESYTNTILLPITQSEPPVTIVFLPMPHYSINKTHNTILVQWLVLKIHGKNGTSTSFGVMRVKMKTRSSGMLSMVSVTKSSHGLETGCSLENGVLLPTLKLPSVTETSSNNLQAE